jgi:hypothetical protein
VGYQSGKRNFFSFNRLDTWSTELAVVPLNREEKSSELAKVVEYQ